MTDWGKTVENKSYGNPGSYQPTRGTDAEVTQHLVDHHGLAEDQAVEVAHDPHTYHTAMHHSGYSKESKVAENTVPHSHPFGKTVIAENVHPHVEGDEEVDAHAREHHKGDDLWKGSNPSSHSYSQAHTAWHNKYDHSPGGTNPTADHVHAKPAWPEDNDAAIKHMQDQHGLKGSYAKGFDVAAAHLAHHQSSFESNKGHSHLCPEPELTVPEHHEHEHLDSTDHLKAMHGYESQHLKGKNQTQLSHEHMTLHKDMQGAADHYHPEEGGAKHWKWGSPKGPLDETEALAAHLNYGHNIKPQVSSQNNKGVVGPDKAQNLYQHKKAHDATNFPGHEHHDHEGLMAKGTMKPELHPTPSKDLEEDEDALHAHVISHHWDASKGEMPMPGDFSVIDHQWAHKSDANDKDNPVPHAHAAHPSDIPNPMTTIKHPADIAEHMAMEHGVHTTGKYTEHQLGKLHQHYHNETPDNSPHTHEKLSDNEQITTMLDEPNHPGYAKESTLLSTPGAINLLDFFKENV